MGAIEVLRKSKKKEDIVTRLKERDEILLFYFKKFSGQNARSNFWLCIDWKTGKGVFSFGKNKGLLPQKDEKGLSKNGIMREYFARKTVFEEAVLREMVEVLIKKK